jgi:hypothetical protein
MEENVSLRDYQVADLAFYMANPRCGNLSDPGTGKTPSVCVYMSWLWFEKGVRSIWTMPKSLLEKNRRELLRFSDLRPEDVVIVDAAKPKRSKNIQKDAKVFLCGFRCFTDNWPEMVEAHPDIGCLIGDEWHMGFKTATSQRSGSMFRFMDRTPRLVAMTGTMIDGRLDTCYPFLNVCNPGLYLGGHDGFLMAHGIENDYGQVVAWRGHERIANYFREYAIRHTFEEAYGPEAKVLVVEDCDMDSKQREAYTEFEETALYELEDSWLSGELPGVNQIRCRQLMEHPQTFGPPLDDIKTTGKEERLMVHLEDHIRTKKPLVIFAAFKPQHERLKKICMDMGFRVGVINGEVSAKRRAEIDLYFREGEVDIVIASAATAGVGFNWGHVDHVLFMSLDPMDSNFVQAYRRAIRGKRDKPLLITVMKYRDSQVESRIFQIVEEKSLMAHKVDNSKERIELRSAEVEEPKRHPLEVKRVSMLDFISRN